MYATVDDFLARLPESEQSLYLLDEPLVTQVIDEETGEESEHTEIYDRAHIETLLADATDQINDWLLPLQPPEEPDSVLLRYCCDVARYLATPTTATADATLQKRIEQIRSDLKRRSGGSAGSSGGDDSYDSSSPEMESDEARFDTRY